MDLVLINGKFQVLLEWQIRYLIFLEFNRDKNHSENILYDDLDFEWKLISILQIKIEFLIFQRKLNFKWNFMFILLVFLIKKLLNFRFFFVCIFLFNFILVISADLFCKFFLLCLMFLKNLIKILQRKREEHRIMNIL